MIKRPFPGLVRRTTGKDKGYLSLTPTCMYRQYLYYVYGGSIRIQSLENIRCELFIKVISKKDTIYELCPIYHSFCFSMCRFSKHNQKAEMRGGNARGRSFYVRKSRVKTCFISGDAPTIASSQTNTRIRSSSILHSIPYRLQVVG